MRSFRRQLGICQIFRAFNKKTLSLLVVLLLGRGAHADLVLQSPFDLEIRPLGHDAYTDRADARTHTLLEPQPDVTCQPICMDSEFEALHINSVNSNAYTGIPDLMREHASFLMEADLDSTLPSNGYAVQVLGEGQSSLSLCLSALMGLGLYSSAYSLRRLPFGSIPQWYHNAGPIQVGHSMAVDSDAARPRPARCFVQAIHAVADVVEPWRLGTLESLCRTSHLTPNLLAGRAPPTTCQSIVLYPAAPMVRRCNTLHQCQFHLRNALQHRVGRTKNSRFT